MTDILDFKSVEELRFRHQEGDRLTLGFWWIESMAIDSKKWMFAGGWIVSAFLALVLLKGGDGWGLLFLVSTVVFFLLWRKARPPVASRFLGLAFATDGKVSIVDDIRKPERKPDPHKLPWMTLKRSIDEIANISLQPTKNVKGGHFKFKMLPGHDTATDHFAYTVVIDFTTGDRIELGGHITERAGRVVQIQSNQALEKIRAERLERMARQSPPATAPDGPHEATEATGRRWAPFGH